MNIWQAVECWLRIPFGVAAGGFGFGGGGGGGRDIAVAVVGLLRLFHCT